MPDHVEPPQNTFVVRFWWEWQRGSADRARGWRGRIEHIQSGEGMTFRNVHELLTFIERFVTPLSPPPGDEER